MVIHRTSNQQQLPVPYSAKKGLSWKMAGKVIGRVLLALLLILLLLAVFGTAAHAAGLVDDTVDAANEYSKYPLDNYQLDFYVDSGWDWLPWNWLDGIGKQVMYGLYAITNFIWTISLYLSNATGYLIQEAYSLDFISSTADSIGKNMQTLAGVTTGGLSSEGFYIGFLLILILVVGIYVAYTGLIKRETTKAIHAVVNFVVVFVLSAAFIAYAPDYIGKINEFSADISNASLTLGTKIVLPNSESQGKDSVDLIRDSLFSIQVKQPWLLLQYGNSDVESLGADRVERLLSTSPDENNGQDREEIVAEEIEDRENTNLTITKTINRLGTVFFLFMFNIGISIFVFLLTGIMIFSQVLFIIYAMFLPHGLGHMMGMDVHDMENLDQINVGFDEEVRPNLEQFGTNCLRMGRRLQEGFVVTDEPGVYFIPALIDDWKASGHCAEFLNFDKIETYKDFGGIRIEDDVLITKDGCRFLGKDRIPYHPKDVEEFMAANKE